MCSVEEEEEEDMDEEEEEEEMETKNERVVLHCIVILWRIYLFIIPNICWGILVPLLLHSFARACPNDIYFNDNVSSKPSMKHCR